MKRQVAAATLFGLVLARAAACPGADANGREPSDSDSDLVDSAVWEALEEASEVHVFVALRGLDAPIEEQPLDVVRSHTAEVQARALAILEPGDFEIYHQYAVSPALSGMATAAGVEKLSTHPDVTGIE